MKYTEQELEFLKNHYPTYGGKYCQSYLKNRSIDAINAIASRLGLKIINKQVHPDLQAISITNFNNIDKNTAYFLGYFWADGYIYNYVSNNINNWRIILEIQEEDAISILPIMNKLGKWSIQKRKRNNTWKTTWSFVTNNKELYNFLLENDYRDKSILEPTKILKLIPENLHNYFWKGFIDGDGSLGIIGRGSYFELASTYNYKYIEFEKYISNYNAKGVIYKQISKKNHSSSVYKIYGKKILNLEPLFIDFGLQRKTNKFKLIKEKYANSANNTKRFL
jgi:hypothetical protein